MKLLIKSVLLGVIFSQYEESDQSVDILYMRFTMRINKITGENDIRREILPIKSYETQLCLLKQQRRAINIKPNALVVLFLLVCLFVCVIGRK